MASIKKGARPGARSLPDHGTCLTGEPATDQTLFELAEVLAEIARDTVGRSAQENESLSSEGTHDDR